MCVHGKVYYYMHTVACMHVTKHRFITPETWNGTWRLMQVIHTNCHKSMSSERDFEEQSCITWNMATVGRSKHTVQHSMPFSRSSKHERSTGPPSLAFFGDGSSVSTSSSGISPGVTVALVELAVDKPSSAISRLIYFAIYTRVARWCRNWIGPSN